MHERPPAAFRTAVLFTILAAACTDAPLGPHHTAPARAGSSTAAGSIAFTGRQADSILQLYDVVWARGSSPDSRKARHVWRKTYGIPDSVGDPRFAPIFVTPNADLLYGDDGTSRPAPTIISHYEALHFGVQNSYATVPDAVEADVVFTGDQAEIAAGTLTITGKNGATYPITGNIAQGPGEIVSCSDALTGSCDRRHLNGVVTVPAAPTCDASGSGTVNYFASTTSTPLAIGSFSSGAVATVSMTGQVSASASPCSTGTGGGQTDSTSTGPVGVPSAPPPPPSGPYVPSYPPTSGGTTSTYFHCEIGETYQNGSLFETTITCYPS